MGRGARKLHRKGAKDPARAVEDHTVIRRRRSNIRRARALCASRPAAKLTVASAELKAPTPPGTSSPTTRGVNRPRLLVTYASNSLDDARRLWQLAWHAV
jgi:hypothetical protein